ncbi:hypothetical protein [Rhodococcus sp. 14-2483-1-2]|uniref:hypothetical protein n=1 Tax=Rhodococcus sp. 14-2483-1-2 TaxID=2023147 RepID=UPI0011404A1B|nr:hypothetical protein [Rhodococcus sp. 14-2483-1-2]
MPFMADIDELVSQVWNPASKVLAAEVWRCYNAGAVRASIVSLWTTITVDLITKIGHLADDGDSGAIKIRADIIAAQQKGLQSEGIRQMQDIERDLLDHGEKLELFDGLDKRALDRIRDDRNVCVHPTLRGMETPYVPQREVARAHLAVALEVLLLHPPTQGLKLIERYSAFTSGAIFTPTPELIVELFYRKVRAGIRRTIVEIAAKHSFLELPTDTGLPASELADRNAKVLTVLADQDRPLVLAAAEKLRERYAALDGDAQLRALARLGDQDFFWDTLNQTVTGHLDTLVGKPPTSGDHVPLKVTAAAVLSLVGNSLARQKLPALEGVFDSLTVTQKVSAITTRPTQYFVPSIVAMLKNASSYAEATEITPALISHSRFLSVQQLAAVLTECSANGQCWHAYAMPPTLLKVYRETTHLGTDRVSVFQDFLDRMSDENHKSSDVYYTYPQLRAAIAEPVTS